MLNDKFNQLVDNLPNSITRLKLNYYFNQSIDNLLNSITHLILDFNFNKSINKLPNFTTCLKHKDRTYHKKNNQTNIIDEYKTKFKSINE